MKWKWGVLVSEWHLGCFFNKEKTNLRLRTLVNMWLLNSSALTFFQCYALLMLSMMMVLGILSQEWRCCTYCVHEWIKWPGNNISKAFRGIYTTVSTILINMITIILMLGRPLSQIASNASMQSNLSIVTAQPVTAQAQRERQKVVFVDRWSSKQVWLYYQYQ